jgi:hypothetical protein
VQFCRWRSPYKYFEGLIGEVEQHHRAPFLEPLTVLDASDDFNPAVLAAAEECNVAYTSLDTRFNVPYDTQCLPPEKELELEIKATRTRKAFQVHTSIPPSSAS